jgi:hypothetical protein
MKSARLRTDYPAKPVGSIILALPRHACSCAQIAGPAKSAQERLLASSPGEGLQIKQEMEVAMIGLTWGGTGAG